MSAALPRHVLWVPRYKQRSEVRPYSEGAFDNLRAGNAGERQVGEEQLNRSKVLTEQSQGFEAVSSDQHVVAIRLEAFLHYRADHRIVLNHKDRGRLARRSTGIV